MHSSGSGGGDRPSRSRIGDDEKTRTRRRDERIRTALRSLPARLRTARETLGLTQDEMALRNGISPRAWQDYEMGNTMPRAQVLASLCEEGFDANWLLTGKGPMRRERAGPAWEVKEGVADLKPHLQQSRRRAAAEPEESRVINIVLAAYHAAFLIQSLRIQPEAVSIRFVRGDAMEPALRDGEPVLVDTQSHDPVEGIYALHLQGTASPIFRRLQQMPGGVYRASCENPTYEPFDFQPGQAVEIIGRVVWAGKRL